MQIRDPAANQTRGYIETGTGGIYGDCLIISSDQNIILDAYYGTMYLEGNMDFKDGRVLSDVRPATNDIYDLGSSNQKWFETYTHYVRTGDLCFSETECAICGERFKDGDILALLLKTIDEDDYTLTIPVHDKCKGISKTITVQIPARVERYRLDSKGSIEKYLDIELEEVEEENYFIDQDFRLDENKGLFRRVGVKGFSTFCKGDIQIGDFASQYEKVVEAKISKIKKPKFKDVTITVNQKNL